ncbi:hypothetical protein Daura_01645 [Dactylosporangium aurantiacum]|uniref:Uncharacterized protein n=1 Tax=Dactylosporangium aurantiacum TaxID=35754 RepID=A0A9Q9IVA6_9ACTN|nr:hypothetical protein Daura_01645 [Dactylosporangium aurantiacum]
MQPVVRAADRQGADAELAHLPRGVRGGLALADALGSRVHDVSRLPPLLHANGLLMIIQRAELTGHGLPSRMAGVFGVAGLAELVQQLFALPSSFRLINPGPARRQATLGGLHHLVQGHGILLWRTSTQESRQQQYPGQRYVADATDGTTPGSIRLASRARNCPSFTLAMAYIVRTMRR